MANDGAISAARLDIGNAIQKRAADLNRDVAGYKYAPPISMWGVEDAEMARIEALNLPDDEHFAAVDAMAKVLASGDRGPDYHELEPDHEERAEMRDEGRR